MTAEEAAPGTGHVISRISPALMLYRRLIRLNKPLILPKHVNYTNVSSKYIDVGMHLIK